MPHRAEIVQYNESRHYFDDDNHMNADSVEWNTVLGKGVWLTSLDSEPDRTWSAPTTLSTCVAGSQEYYLLHWAAGEKTCGKGSINYASRSGP